MALLAGLTGCYVPPPPPPQVPLVAIPGPSKTQAQFQQDDAACRTAAAAPASAPQANSFTNGSSAVNNVAGQASSANPSTSPLTGSAGQLQPTGDQMPPGAVYLRCMVSRANIVQPLATQPPPLYAFYPQYPIYVGFGDTYPWLYDGFGYGGFYGGFYGGYRGYRGGYGYGGFRDGGFRDGGFGGGGFRGGDGFGRGGGFRR